MLPIPVMKTLIKTVPRSVTIDGSERQLQRTFGKAVLSTITSPTVNLAIVSDGKRVYRSMDDNTIIAGNTVTSSDIRGAIVQYTIASTGIQSNTSDILKKMSSVTCVLPKTPVLDITSVTGYTKNIDYKLLDDHETLQWLTSGPALGSNFTVNYSWIEDGYWATFGIADYLMKDILSNLRNNLSQYDVDVTKVGDVVDLSAIYSNTALSVCSFDVHLTYPYTWTRTVTEEYGDLIESIYLDLIVNDLYTGTIEVP